MATGPRKPWRVTTVSAGVPSVTTTRHTSRVNAYRHVTAQLRTAARSGVTEIKVYRHDPLLQQWMPVETHHPQQTAARIAAQEN